MSKPIVDKITESMVSKLSFETKLKMYQDLKDEYPDAASDIMESNSIEEALDEFAFNVFWSVQHQLLNKFMSDEEIEQRIYR